MRYLKFGIILRFLRPVSSITSLRAATSSASPSFRCPFGKPQ
jgi:hypothetical protein